MNLLTFSDIAKLFEEIEIKLIASLKRNLHRHKSWEKDEGFEWTQWQALKLRNLESFRRENRKIMGEYTPVIDEETHKLMKEQFYEGENLVDEQIKKLQQSDKTKIATNENFFGINEKKMNALVNDITVIEKKAETSALRLMDDVYRQTLHKVQLEMATGSTTLPKAVDIAVKDFLTKGINSIIYKDGRRINIADYVRMALRTTSTRAALQGQAKRWAELGYDTVLVSQYGMCSDTCLPYQGKVYIDDVFTVWNGVSNGDYGKSSYCNKWFMLLSVAIRGGLFHPNCRHSLNLWVDGVSKMPKPLDAEKVKVNAKLEQKQRRLENDIRKWKRLVIGSGDAENIALYKGKVKNAQKVLRDFIKENEDVLRRDYSKEKVYETVDKSVESGIIKESNKKPITKITDNAIDRVPKVNVGGYSDEQNFLIQQQHKELLKYARDNNDSNEVAFVFDGDLKTRKQYMGTDDRLDFGNTLYGEDLFVMHNHPRNGSYSYTDLVEFIGNNSIKVLSIVKNNGKIETLTKLCKCDRLKLAIELERLKKNGIKTGSDSEYQKIVDKFLNKQKENGGIEWLN